MRLQFVQWRETIIRGAVVLTVIVVYSCNITPSIAPASFLRHPHDEKVLLYVIATSPHVKLSPLGYRNEIHSAYSKLSLRFTGICFHFLFVSGLLGKLTIRNQIHGGQWKCEMKYNKF